MHGESDVVEEMCSCGAVDPAVVEGEAEGDAFDPFAILAGLLMGLAEEQGGDSWGDDERLGIANIEAAHAGEDKRDVDL